MKKKIPTSYRYSWVTRFINFWKKRKLPPVFTSLIFFHLLPSGLVLLVFSLTGYWGTFFSRGFNILFPGFLGFFMPAILPYLTWRYETKVLPRFFSDLSAFLGQSEEAPEDLISKFNKLTKILKISIQSLGAFLQLYYAFKLFDAAQQIFRVPNMWSPSYLIVVAVGAFLVYLAGLGLALVSTSTARQCLIIRSLEPSNINPTHFDRLGGTGFFNRLSVTTAAFLIPMSLAIPFFAQIIPRSIAPNLPFFFVPLAIYLIIIISAFSIPTAFLAHTLKRTREFHLSGWIKEYEKSFTEFRKTTDTNQILLINARTTQLREHYREVEKMRILPWKPNVLFLLLGTLIFPLVIALIQHLLGRLFNAP
ncbi:hypothetical protein CEE36_02470 [candidate division TA06 bacterium B3_TA06]|uniref:Uncharacterized protein n=1 Tax=candidate division TA06 bacterium B3_TA06 TaxID=2012487 RepID=A0A532V9X5_UNCT6|nr:MAG: hypothetical protein CEE36_02470 [candidate division TA06 bacterium B3_TA06]